MTVLRYLHLDVFTDRPLTGNQLAVFPDAHGVSADLMQDLAREMAFSESTFVLPPEDPATSARLRIFTPAKELPMAGHPTIGSTFALADRGAIAPPGTRWVFGLGVGPTPVDLEWRDGHLAFAWMTQRLPVFGAPLGRRDLVTATLGLEEDALVRELPAQVVSCGVPFLLVPLVSREVVDRVIPDTAAVNRLAAAHGVDGVPIYAFSIDPGGEGRVYSRMFAGGFGIAEDPATGSACGPLGCYLVRHGVVSGALAGSIVNLQGVKMQRPSRLHVAVDVEGPDIRRVRVGGQAVVVGEGELRV